MLSHQSFNLQNGNSLCVRTLMVGMLVNGVGKKKKAKLYRYRLTCRKPWTYAKSVLNVGAKKDAQDNVNV